MENQDTLPADCFQNPDSEKCRIPKQALESLRSKKARKKDKNTVLIGGVAVVAKKVGTGSDVKICLDSGASHTMFGQPSEVESGTYRQSNSGANVELAAGEASAPVLGSGTVQYGNITVRDAVHVKGLNSPLLSVGQLCDSGKLVIFTSKEAVVVNRSTFQIDEEDIVERVARDRTGLYCLNATVEESAGSLWHRRLAHCGEQTIRKVAKDGMSIQLQGPHTLKVCGPCRMEKATHKSFDSSFKPADHPGQIVHSDLSGPLPTSVDGCKYLVTFTDQNSRLLT